MQTIFRVLTLLAALVLASASAAAEINTNRPGSDYTDVTLPGGSTWHACEALCKADGSSCKAWTFVKPGTQANNPRCWLKSSVPPAVSDGCCTSGINLPVVEANTNRPGSDYTNVTLPGGSAPGACQSLCDADNQCAAWTFVKPGVQATNPRCWLKDAVPPKVPDNCCASGVK